MTPEEERRLDELYGKLSTRERRYVVCRWIEAGETSHYMADMAAEQGEARARERRYNRNVLVGLVLVAFAGFCFSKWQAASDAREKLEWIYQEGVRDSGLKPVLERIDRERAEYYESLKPDEEPE
jgi:hypothetical protein